MPSTGTRNSSITASDAAASGFGCDCTITLQRRHAEGRGGVPLAARRRADRLGRAIRAPNFDSSAGSTVSDASIVSSTASTDAIASP